MVRKFLFPIEGFRKAFKKGKWTLVWPIPFIFPVFLPSINPLWVLGLITLMYWGIGVWWEAEGG